MMYCSSKGCGSLIFNTHIIYLRMSRLSRFAAGGAADDDADLMLVMVVTVTTTTRTTMMKIMLMIQM